MMKLKVFLTAFVLFLVSGYIVSGVFFLFGGQIMDFETALAYSLVYAMGALNWRQK